MTTSLISALHANGPALDRADKLSLYGWLIGDWKMDVVVFGPDDRKYEGRGEIHFGWVLEGRAIQDVWILPGIFHGTTLRVYDPGIDAWHIVWSDPLKQYYSRQIGRAQGKDIVQIGKNDAGKTTRWSFRDIAPDAFRWLGEVSGDDGRSWALEAEFRARRVGAPAQVHPVQGTRVAGDR
ncbi:MAG TPA: hypothetical protein VFB54_18915 [Burkholderiales bacterium]|nr:hypothetical protein [Burkholderiales bacterium]